MTYFLAGSSQLGTPTSDLMLRLLLFIGHKLNAGRYGRAIGRGAYEQGGEMVANGLTGVLLNLHLWVLKWESSLDPEEVRW